MIFWNMYINYQRIDYKNPDKKGNIRDYKAVGFWANIKTFTVNDVKGYNHATGKLFYDRDNSSYGNL